MRFLKIPTSNSGKNHKESNFLTTALSHFIKLPQLIPVSDCRRKAICTDPTIDRLAHTTLDYFSVVRLLHLK